MNIDEILGKLYLECTQKNPSKTSIASAIEDVLVWLNKSENNTDSNYKRVDYYVVKNIISNDVYDYLSEDIKEIIFDMGGALHDTHTSPEIAENFESTPQQLLKRVRKLSHRNEI